MLHPHGLSVVISTNDHQPAHVRVFGDGKAKINLLGVDGIPELVWAAFAAPCASLPQQQAFLLAAGRKSMAELIDAEIDAAVCQARGGTE